MSYLKTIEEIASNYARKLGVNVKFASNLAYSTQDTIVLPRLEQLDGISERLLYGLMTHEAGHIHYSDFKVFGTITNPILQEMVNALEDCRIEYLMGKNYIGAFENLNFVNQCIYCKQWEQHFKQAPKSKIKLIILYLIVQTQAYSLHYSNADELALLLKQELSCLINPEKVALLEDFTHDVVAQDDTNGIYQLVSEIYQLFATENFFVPNFERFVLANNTNSTFDLNNAKALAKLYGQSFSAPTLGPQKEALDICSCESLIAKSGLNLSESEVNEQFIPEFIAPSIPEYNDDIVNLKYMVQCTSLDDINQSHELSNNAVGNLQEASFLCKSTAKRERIYNQNFPLASFTDQLQTLLNLDEQNSSTSPSARASAGSCACLNASSSAASYSSTASCSGTNASASTRASTKDGLGSAAKTKANTKLKGKGSNNDTDKCIDHTKDHCAPLDMRFNPLYGPYKDKVSLLKAINLYQLHLRLNSDTYTDSNSQEFIKHNFNVLTNEIELTPQEQDIYERLIKPNLSLELATRILLMQVANPMRYRMLLRYVNLPHFYQSTEDIDAFVNIQNQRLAYINKLRAIEINAPTTFYDMKELTTLFRKDFNYLKTYYSKKNNPVIVANILEAISERNCYIPTFIYDQSFDETKLLSLDSGYHFKSKPNSFQDEIILKLMHQRLAAQYQRKEAILKELHLYDEYNIDPKLTIDPLLYCKDSKGRVYLKYYYERTLAALSAWLQCGLNDQQQTIPMVVDRYFFVPISNYHRLHHNFVYRGKATHNSNPNKMAKSANGHFIDELFRNTKALSSWSIQTNPVSETSAFGQKSLEELEQGYKRLSMEQKRANSLYMRYTRFINNIAFSNNQEQCNFHKTLLNHYESHSLNLRDPRAENSFTDALVEYYFDTYQELFDGEPNTASKPNRSSSPNNLLENYRSDLVKALPQTNNSMESVNSKSQSSSQQQHCSLPKITFDALREKDFNAMLCNLSRSRDSNSASWLRNKQHIYDRLSDQQVKTFINGLLKEEQKHFIADVVKNLGKLRELLSERLIAYFSAQEISNSHGKKIDMRKAQFIELGEQKIFKQKEMVAKTDTLVHLLIDVSSSMSSKENFFDKELKFNPDSAGYIACQSALNIALCLQNIDKVSCEVTYFPGAAPDEPYLQVLYEHEKASDQAKYFLQIPRYYTPTALAINYALQRMKHQEYRRKIIILITDGMPDSPLDTVKAFNQAKKQKVEIYSLGIFTNDNIIGLIKSIFPDITTLKDYHELPEVLSHLIAQRFANN